VCVRFCRCIVFLFLSLSPISLLLQQLYSDRFIQAFSPYSTSASFASPSNFAFYIHTYSLTILDHPLPIGVLPSTLILFTNFTLDFFRHLFASLSSMQKIFVPCISFHLGLNHVTRTNTSFNALFFQITTITTTTTTTHHPTLHHHLLLNSRLHFRSGHDSSFLLCFSTMSVPSGPDFIALWYSVLLNCSVGAQEPIYDLACNDLCSDHCPFVSAAVCRFCFFFLCSVFCVVCFVCDLCVVFLFVLFLCVI
jgi:hypothetical protein